MVDYLSTVSGGGYIGGWLAAWIRREGDLENVQKQLRPLRIYQAEAQRAWLEPDESDADGRTDDRGRRRVEGVVEEEPEPIYHLRQYSNYLAPTTGPLSIDTWSMLSTYGRNFLLTQLILLPAAMALILVPRLLMLGFDRDPLPDRSHTLLGLAMFLLGGASIGAINRFLRARRLARSAAPTEPAGDTQEAEVRWARRGLWWFRLCIVMPLILATVLFSFLFSNRDHPGLYIPGIESIAYGPDSWLGRRMGPALAFGVVGGCLRLVWFLLSWWRSLRTPAARRVGWGEFAGRGLSSVLAASTSAACLYATMSWTRATLAGSPELLAPTMAAFGPPLATLTFLLSSSIEAGLLGAMEDEETREWRASLGAFLLLYGVVAWAATFAISLYGPLLIAAAGPVKSAILGSGWLATSIAGVLAGGSARTRGGRRGPWEYLARFAPPVFVVGLLVLVAIVGCLISGFEPPTSFDRLGARLYWDAMEDVPLPWTCAALGACVTATGLLSWRLNVNLFSLHAFYANRLIRCYLGASRPEGFRPPGRPHYAPSDCPHPVRHPNPITGFDPDDDLPLRELKAYSNPAVAGGEGAMACAYQGPFPLINTAMNLVSGNELAWQERMAESFVLTPLYSGSKTTGYRKMDRMRSGPDDRDGQPGYGGDLRLGTAVSISGAAASPNMGYHSSPAVTFLMTVFNARLGWWLGNPARESWREPGPRWGFYLFKELLGWTDARRQYIYLSDGGHFENLGVYELIRRRCRYIVACDAGEDPAMAFWDLGSLVRKCREDLGVRIEIDIAPLLKQETWGRSRWHCSIGKIRYDDIDASAIPGMLLYIKPSLTGDEPTDIRNYVVDHPRFPHEPTTNQFFSESQFESYRALGEHIAQEVFRDAASQGDGEASPATIFSRLHRRWFPPPPDFDANFLKSVGAYIEIQGQLRTDPNLGRLSAELYPEVRPEAEGDGARDRAEVHAIGQVLQVMENVWLTVGLENFSEHPMNRGWMNWFRRWSSTEVFQKHWPALRGEFSQDFVRFAEKQLNLRVNPRALIHYPGVGATDLTFDGAMRRLAAEYALEWPTLPWPGGEEYRPNAKENDKAGRPVEIPGGIVQLLEHTIAEAEGFFEQVPAWIIPEPTPRGEGPEAAWNGRGCGVILAWKARVPGGEPDAIELFVWLRGPYRTQGLGRAYVPAAIDELRGWLKGDAIGLPFRVDYPMRDLPEGEDHPPGDLAGHASGSKDRWQSMVWLSFFQGLGFRKRRPETPEDEVLALYHDGDGTPR